MRKSEGKMSRKEQKDIQEEGNRERGMHERGG